MSRDPAFTSLYVNLSIISTFSIFPLLFTSPGSIKRPSMTRQSISSSQSSWASKYHRLASFFQNQRTSLSLNLTLEAPIKLDCIHNRRRGRFGVHFTSNHHLDAIPPTSAPLPHLLSLHLYLLLPHGLAVQHAANETTQRVNKRLYRGGIASKITFPNSPALNLATNILDASYLSFNLASPVRPPNLIKNVAKSAALSNSNPSSCC